MVDELDCEQKHLPYVEELYGQCNTETEPPLGGKYGAKRKINWCVFATKHGNKKLNQF